MPLQRLTRLVVAVGFSLAVLGSLTPAKGEENAGAADPRVERIVKAALQHIAAAKGIAFEARIVNEVPLDSGQKVQNISTLKGFVRRPDRFTAIRKGDNAGTMYYDGKQYALWKAKENVYAVWDAPATLDALFDTMPEKLGFAPPLMTLLRSDVGSGARQDQVLAAEYVGLTEIDGADCHHVAFATKDVDVQFWIAEGIPVIKRIVVTYKKIPYVPQYTATFLNWDFNAQLEDYVFSFIPPPDASRIEFVKRQNP